MKIVAPILTLAMLAGVYLETRGHPTPENAAPFHAKVAASVAEVPLTVGHWEGANQEMPQAAQALLRPNASLCRNYRSTVSGREVSLILIQCKDSRDMAGHYPPRCYPGNGWEQSSAERSLMMKVGDTQIPVTRYEYQRSSFGHSRKLAIYGFFVLPGRGIVTSMSEVYRAAEFYTARPFGAAQIQLVVDAMNNDEDDAAAFDELMTPLLPTIALLRSAPEEVSK